MQIFEVKNFSKIREERQENNDIMVRKSSFTKHVNVKAMNRVQDRLRMTREQLLYQSPEFLELLSMHVSINSSRQGTKDETYVIEGIAGYLKAYGISIENLGTHDMVPLQDGRVLSRKECKKLDIPKNQKLKSFDFKGSALNKTILGFAKVCVGQGGHQDNVYLETVSLLDWINNHGDSDHLYIIMIDGLDKQANKKYNSLKSSYSQLKNVFIGSHIKVQTFLKERYGN